MKHLLLLTSNYPDQDSVNLITENIYLSYATIKNVTIQKYVCDSGKIPSVDKFHYLIIIHPMVLRTFEFQKIIESTPLKTKIIFHVFGDYVRKSSLYLIHNDLLKGRNLTFITASRAYKNLVDKSIAKGSSAIVPFAVNDHTFYHSSKLRSEFRRQYKIADHQKVLIYTGRISPQKNIHLLLETFSHLKKNNDSVVLFLIGNIDDFEQPTFAEKTYLPGEYYYQLSTLIDSISPDSLKILPRMDSKSLNKAYNGADLFISLSLYHDEDYGYSPLEALCTGCPAYLSSWGGYKDFQLISKSTTVKYAKVNFKIDTLIISPKVVVKDIEAWINTKSTNRSKIAKNFSTKYGIIKTSHALKKNIDIKNKFAGFTEKFATLSLQMQTSRVVDLKLYKFFYEGFWKNL